jgi:hypothetical protein
MDSCGFLRIPMNS